MGEQVAFYFTFLEFYNTTLLSPGRPTSRSASRTVLTRGGRAVILGVILFVWQMLADTIAVPGLPVYGDAQRTAERRAFLTLNDRHVCRVVGHIFLGVLEAAREPAARAVGHGRL